ncbi:MAG TPA: RagB/SusD family nutrient uptake outer membrane protein [Bacteroidales bacterium]|jgi:tetratricopeptide (TPR) repeat protein|nr:RagB/SusD family nutrient uptake outer membrane protein [Bacteroidales bacterium]
MIRIILYSFILYLCSGCTNNFLDKQPSFATTNNKLLESAQGIKSALNGCYSQLQSQYYYGRNFILIQETFTDNAKLSNKNVGHFSSFYLWSVTANNEELSQLWAIAYNIIVNINAILPAAEKNTHLKQSEKDIIKGEALTLRAIIYYDLVRLFAHDYSITSGIAGANGKGGHAGIPLITSPISLDSAKKVSRSSVNTVFNQILTDALHADSLLQQQTFSPLRCNQKTAQTLVANIYLHLKNYNKAIEYANKALESIQLEQNNTYIQSWSQQYSTESIFSVCMTPTDNPGTNSIGHMLSPKGYGGIVPSEDLLKIINTTDIRSQFIQKYQEYYFIKFPEINNTLGINNIPVFRASELYFILAEAFANKGKTVPGFYTLSQQALQSIKQRAYNSQEPVTLTGDNLLNEIYEEYRKEFAFEGKRLFQLKRLHQDIARKNCNTNNCILSCNNYKYTFPIPYSEIQTNKNITQNPGY